MFAHENTATFHNILHVILKCVNIYKQKKKAKLQFLVLHLTLMSVRLVVVCIKYMFHIRQIFIIT